MNSKLIEILKAQAASYDEPQKVVVEAMLELGKIYAADDSDPENKNRAIQWWKAAAKQNEPSAFINLGRLYAQLYATKREEGVSNPERIEAFRQSALSAFQPLVQIFEQAPDHTRASVSALAAEAAFSSGMLHHFRVSDCLDELARTKKLKTKLESVLILPREELDERVSMIEDYHERARTEALIEQMRRGEVPFQPQFDALDGVIAKELPLAIENYETAVKAADLADDAPLQLRAVNSIGCLYDLYGTATGLQEMREDAYDRFLLAAQAGWGESCMNVALMIEGNDAPKNLWPSAVAAMNRAERAKKARYWMRAALKDDTYLPPKARQQAEAFLAGEGNRPLVKMVSRQNFEIR